MSMEQKMQEQIEGALHDEEMEYKLKWIDVKNQLPDFGEEIEVTYDGGETIEDSIIYMEKRTCMMAGIAGGNGYFGAGFAMSGNNGCDRGLIVDEPTHWRYI